MEILLIPAKSKEKIKLTKSILDKLPKKVGLCTTVQYLDQLKSIQKQIMGSIIGGQVLGCNVSKALGIKNKVNAFLYIGTGKFHPLYIAIHSNKKVFTYNPHSKDFINISKEEIEKYQKRQRGALLKFLNSDVIGILVSIKPGQNKLKQSKLIKNKLEKEGKKCYIFIGDQITKSELENFPFIQAWINTACPRLEEDMVLLNYQDHQ
jgi:2-(3-amino-3-carboxypropyl)histidine synthase